MSDVNEELGRTEEQEKEMVGEIAENSGEQGETEGKERKKEKKTEKKKTGDKYKKLRKVLSTAALSAALISWYTTANGLHQYVFAHLWQAYVISAALQGALFTLSIMGIEILLSFKIGKRLLLGATWACLLVASSIFSYVYISRDVYPDRSLCEDAHRVLSTYCLSKNYELDAASDELLHGKERDDGTGIVTSMADYAGHLAVLEDGIDLAEGGNDTKLETVKETLIKYAYSGDESNAEYVDTSYLIRCLDIILTGQYTEQDIKDTEKEAQNLINAIDKKIEANTQKKEDRISDKASSQDRLEGYKNTEIAAYANLTGVLKNEKEEVKEAEGLINDLENEKSEINRVFNVLDSLENSAGSVLYNQVIRLLSALNAEKLQVEDVRQIAEEIYNALLEHNIMDSRFQGYSEFMDNVTKYDTVVRAKEGMGIEIEELYDLKSVYELTHKPIGYSDEETVSDNIASRNSMDGTRIFDIEPWRYYWQEHLNSLKRSAKMLRAGGLDERQISNLIAEIEEKERLYLSDLNDFERAWELLWGGHPYKTSLKFSFVVSAGIDLFSVLMSILLYIFKKKGREADLL